MFFADADGVGFSGGRDATARVFGGTVTAHSMDLPTLFLALETRPYGV